MKMSKERVYVKNFMLKYYWCIKVSEDVSPDNEIYLYSDYVKIVEGNLIFIRIKDDITIPVFAIAKGKWTTFFAASVWDGHAYHVEHWKGEIDRLKSEYED